MTPTQATQERVQRIYELLLQAYGEPRREGRSDPVGELVGTIISQHTSDTNTDRAYANLLATFGTWEAVRDATPEAIASAIKSAGLSNVKAPRIKAVLQTIHSRYGSLNLDHLAQLPLREAKAALRSLPGIGPKTAACTLLFAFDLPAFPVDVHIHRVSRRLGLIGESASAEVAHDVLEPLLPPDHRTMFAFHVLMIRHGRQTCRALSPRCPDCPLLVECLFGRRSVGLQE